MRTTIQRICEHCGSPYQAFPWANRKYCSRACGTEARHIPIEKRFLSFVKKTAQCWIWQGTRNRGGYGQFTINKKGIAAHRFAYTFYVGTIPEGLQLDHLCRNTSCVNPSHLEPVTQVENIRRSEGISVQLAKRTKCSKGHDFTGRHRGYRRCLVCHREAESAHYHRRTAHA